MRAHLLQGLLVLVLTLASLGTAGAAERQRFALVIGNGQYVGVGALRNPENDARLVAATLRDLGFKVDEHLNLGHRTLKRAVARFARKVAAAGRNSVALVYYAGHGLQVNGVNYLVPVDAEIKVQGDVPVEGFSTADALATIQSAGAEVNIIVLDACRNNPYPAASRSMTRGLARMDTPNGSIIAYSTAPGAVAADGAGANSLYTQALVKYINQPGLPIEQVFKRVRIDVHKGTSGEQTPWEESSLTSDVFLSSAPAGSSGGAAKPETAPPAVNRDAGDAEIAYLRAIEENTLSAYERFLRRFPSDARARSVRKLVRTMADEKQWRRARDVDSIAAYRLYLTAFPNGIYAQEASEKIESMSSRKVSDAQAWTTAANCLDAVQALPETCGKLRRQIACIQTYRDSQGRSGTHESDAAEAVQELSADLERCENKPAPGGNATADFDGDYIGRRGYHRARGKHCLTEYPQFRASVANGRIEFNSDGRTWTGSVSPDGEVRIDRSGISGFLRHHMRVTGHLTDADMDSGYCGSGWFRLTKVNGGTQVTPASAPAQALPDGNYTASRGYTDPGRPKPHSECPSYVGGLHVAVNGNALEFWLDGRLLRGSISGQGKIEINGNASLVSGRRFRSPFSISGHYSNANMWSGYCRSGFFRIER